MPVIPGLTRKQLGGDLIPDGTYQIRIAQAKYVAAADGKDAKYDYVNVDSVITEEGEFLGRHVFQNITLKPGSAFLAGQIEDALEHPEDQELDTDLWVDGEMLAVISTEKGKAGYSDRNQIKKFLPLSTL